MNPDPDLRLGNHPGLQLRNINLDLSLGHPDLELHASESLLGDSAPGTASASTESTLELLLALLPMLPDRLANEWRNK
jgi:hypothetical protein